MPAAARIAAVALFAVIGGVDAARCTGRGGPDKIQLDPNTYSKADLPARPENVSLTFTINDITDIDATFNVSIAALLWFEGYDSGQILPQPQQVHMNGYLTLVWNDTRVKVTGAKEEDGTVILDKSCLNALWTPDIWVESLVEFTQQKVTGAKLFCAESDRDRYEEFFIGRGPGKADHIKGARVPLLAEVILVTSTLVEVYPLGGGYHLKKLSLSVSGVGAGGETRRPWFTMLSAFDNLNLFNEHKVNTARPH